MIEILMAAIIALTGGQLDKTTAHDHVIVAQETAVAHGLEAELLLGMAFVESRYIPAAVSRIQCQPKCRRMTGVWSSEQAPPGLRPTLFCGVMQTGGYISWAQCLELRDIRRSYRAGAQALQQWLRDPSCARFVDEERLSCALSGYGGGYAAIKLRPTRYALAVLRATAAIKRHVARMT